MLNTKLSLLFYFYSVLLSELGSRNFVIGSYVTLVTRVVVIVTVVTHKEIDVAIQECRTLQWGCIF